MNLHAFVIGTALLLPEAAKAQSSKLPGDYGNMWSRICTTLPFCDRGEELLGQIGSAIVTTVLPILGAAAIASIVWAGIRMITKGEEGYTEAKKIVLVTLIGSFIALAALGIIQFFYNQLIPGGTGGG